MSVTLANRTPAESCQSRARAFSSEASGFELQTDRMMVRSVSATRQDMRADWQFEPALLEDARARL